MRVSSSILSSFILNSLSIAQSLHTKNGVQNGVLHGENETQNGTFHVGNGYQNDYQNDAQNGFQNGLKMEIYFQNEFAFPYYDSWKFQGMSYDVLR